jgi:hypothetical protein
LSGFCAFFAAVEAVNAQTFNSAQPVLPKSGFFIGGGASFSFASFGTQSVYNKGISDAYQDGVLIASGTADGPAGFDIVQRQVQGCSGSTVWIFPAVRGHQLALGRQVFVQLPRHDVWHPESRDSPIRHIHQS